MKRNVRIWLAVLAFAFALPRAAFAQGEDNPTGVTGIYNGNSTIAGNLDPYTMNDMRGPIDDIVVPGSIGAYPLKWTRYFNTRQGMDSPHWTFSYKDYRIMNSFSDHIQFPDGRDIDFQSTCVSGVEEYHDTDPVSGKEAIFLADGGKVLFDSYIFCQLDNGADLCTYQNIPAAMVDPYGQVTTIAREVWGYDWDGHPRYRISRVTEPGGRYLQITWTGPFGNYGDPLEGFIGRVDAYDGVNSSQPIDSVVYNYVGYTPPGGSNTFTVLDHVDYADNSHAYYTYAKPGNITLNTADDVRYTASAMRQIEYQYINNKLTYEKNFTTHEPVTSLTWQDNVNGTDIRTETRGDSPNPSGTPIARTFTYYKSQTNQGDCINQATSGKLKSYTDFLGNTTSLTYSSVYSSPDTGGFITSVTDPNGRVTQYVRGDPTYPSPNQRGWAIYRVIYADGSTIEQTFTDDQNPYFLASRTLQHGPSDPPFTIVYTRDANHRITRKDYPDGGFETFTYNPLGEVLTHRMTSGGTESFVYDTRGLKTSYTDATGGTTTYLYYTSGPWTDRLQTVMHPANASGFQATDTYEYDRTPDSNLNQSGPVHGVGTVTSAIAGRGLVTKIAHADGSYQSFSYNKYGDKLWEEDELGHRTSFTYDDYGRVLTATTPARFSGDTQNHTTTNNYVPTGKTSSEITTSKLPFSTTLPSGKQTTFEYDANWRKTFVHQAPNTADAATTQYVYDTGGSPNIGHLMSMIDPRTNTTTYGYDSRDRQIFVTDALSHTNTVHYNLRGQKDYEIKANTPSGMHAIDYDQYDPMNRLLHKKVLRDGSATPATIDQVSMTYDVAGNLSSNTDENGNIYNYTYDFMNRPTSMVYPNGLTEIHNYDSAGNVESYKNRTGALQFFTYDNRNRPTAFSWDDGTSPQTTAYDVALRKTQILNDDATINFLYYDDNKLKSQEEWETTPNVGDNIHRTVTYTYDPDGNRLTIQYPSGTAFNYAYTNRNQVSAIQPGLSGGTGIVSYTFDPSGNITNRALDNGTSTAYTVDVVNRDTAVVHTLVPNTVVKRFDYAYNAVNDVTAVDRDAGAPDENGDLFSYDLTQQITAFKRDGTGVNLSGGTMTGGTNNTMTFDGCGNRKSLNGTTSNYNNLNQPTDAGITYDLNGNLLTYNGYLYRYDAQNRLRAVLKDQGVQSVIIEQFYYDGLNRQVARALTTPLPTGTPPGVITWDPNPVVTFSVWDGDWAILEEYDGNGNRVQGYVQGYHGLVKTFVGTAVYYYQDELGSTSHIADSTGALLEYYKYDMYGKPKFFSASNSQLQSSSYQVNDLFTGQRWISEIGLYDDRNRFMSPDLGRFLQPDPIGFKGDASNLYRYCGNDWANRSDLSGLDWEAFIYRDPVPNPRGGFYPPGSFQARRASGDYVLKKDGVEQRRWRVNENGFVPNRAGPRAGDYNLVPRGDGWGKSNLPGVTRDTPTITGKEAGLKPGWPDPSYRDANAKPVEMHQPGNQRGQADSAGCPTLPQSAIDQTIRGMKENERNGVGTEIHIRDQQVKRAQPVAGYGLNGSQSAPIYQGGAIGGGTAWGQQTDGSFVDAQGSNTDLGGDNPPTMPHGAAPVP